MKQDPRAPGHFTGITEMARKLFYFWTTPRRRGLTVPNICIVSDPGEGKTMLIEAVARSLGVRKDRSVRWSVGQHDPMDFNGWGVPRDEGLTFEAPASIRRLIQSSEPGLFFLDEANQATPTQQGGLLKLLDSRRIGDEAPLPDHILMGMAMNPPETGAASNDSTAPFRSRLIWQHYSGPTKSEHAAFITSRGAPVIPLPDRLPDAIIERSYNQLGAVYARYMERRGDLREDPLDPKVAARSSSIQTDQGRRFNPAFATPRSWDMALQVAATAHAYGDFSAMTDFLIGAVGPQQGIEFDTYFHEQDLIDPEELLKDPKLWTPDPQRPDRTFAQVLAVAMAATSDGQKEEDRFLRWHAAWDVIKRTMDAGEGKDMTAPAAQHLALPENKPKNGLLASYIDIVRELAPIIVASE